MKASLDACEPSNLLRFVVKISSAPSAASSAPSERSRRIVETGPDEARERRSR